MAITKTSNGKWKVDIQPGGRQAKRFRKQFDTLGEAKRWKTHIENLVVNEKWNPSKDNRRLKELVNIWFESHGKTLKDGARRKIKLDYMVDRLGNPIARLLKMEEYIKDRSNRLSDGFSPKTCNNELSYLKAVYGKLRKLEIIDYETPIDNVEKLKLDETELAFLSHEEIDELLSTINNEEIRLIVEICLSTGARWSEAEKLKKRQVRNSQIHFTKTKGYKNRSIPISDELENKILRIKKVQLFEPSYNQFLTYLRKTSIQLPAGQKSHVLRHTFASHFMINGGNILTLQRTLGHSNISQTMKYAHLAPDHLEEVTRLNPMVK